MTTTAIDPYEGLRDVVRAYDEIRSQAVAAIGKNPSGVLGPYKWLAPAIVADEIKIDEISKYGHVEFSGTTWKTQEEGYEYFWGSFTIDLEEG